MSTGDFNKCAADFDTKARGKGGKDSGPQPLDNLEAERELLQNKVFWTGCLNSFFTCTLGMLAGSSILHMAVLIGLWGDSDKFI